MISLIILMKGCLEAAPAEFLMGRDSHHGAAYSMLLLYDRPLAHVINFRFISTQHRVLYINCVQVNCPVEFSGSTSLACVGLDSELARALQAPLCAL